MRCSEIRNRLRLPKTECDPLLLMLPRDRPFEACWISMSSLLRALLAKPCVVCLTPRPLPHPRFEVCWIWILLPPAPQSFPAPAQLQALPFLNLPASRPAPLDTLAASVMPHRIPSSLGLEQLEDVMILSLDTNFPISLHATRASSFPRETHKGLPLGTHSVASIVNTGAPSEAPSAATNPCPLTTA